MYTYPVLLSVIFMVIFAGCQSEKPLGDSTATFQNETTAVVLIEDFSYKPAFVTVKVGTKVTWVQKDSVRHTVTSNDGIFDSGLLSEGISWEYTFNEVGMYNYYCIPHPYMKGTVEVVE
ncbi:cupredoxin domain-containing protein [Methanococcus maripaludis]|uniref:Blue (Type 1) copper domain n=1 Tax=Methanococcus maripaludis (strain DSM 14266 / JCM 13030 / NBRC 101832 / S2 / LL) TaxID=267377 RepID=Q6LYJ4_METMP|nr:cupredoxin family copper-binding protein [Methanococcus maripaludis]CAF30553.1 Blue (type 1) copper domain [Methanococcus maripaludis S2]